MDVTQAFVSLGISLGLGLLVGIQRERADPALAGVRTFPLIVLLGTVCAMIESLGVPWVVAVGLIAVAGTTAMGNWLRPRLETSPGITTEVAIVLMYGIGVLVWMLPEARQVPIALAAGCAVLLQLKQRLHGLVARFKDNEIRAIMRFAVIWLVVLPIMPDRAMGPWNAINPREVWWMVVLVEGLSLIGYLIYRMAPPRAGLLVGGLLGGVISSTATTVTHARRAKEFPAAAGAGAVVVAIAWAMVFARVFAEISVVAPSMAAKSAGPLAVLAAAGAAGAAAIWFGGRGATATLPEPENPTEIKSALWFAFLYAMVSLAAAGAREYVGPRAMYAVAGLSGLTDMDAITLSTARLAEQGQVAPGAAWRIIVVATLSNVIFKTILAATIGGIGFFKRMLIPAVGTLVAGGLVLAFWP